MFVYPLVFEFRRPVRQVLRFERIEFSGTLLAPLVQCLRSSYIHVFGHRLAYYRSSPVSNHKNCQFFVRTARWGQLQNRLTTKGHVGYTKGTISRP